MSHTVLIVEDNQTLRRLLQYRVGKHHRVLTAENGEQALAVIEGEVPDLIVSDIMMPRMDGFALLAALRQDDRTRTVPFIFLTAKTDDPSKTRGLGQGVDDYITKPFDVDHLLARIEKILERSAVYQNKLNARIGKDFSDRLLPKTMPRVDGYRALFYTQPKEDGGGDLFDWTTVPNPNGDPSGAFMFTVGDIMGKGLQAKFYAFSFLSYIRSTVHAALEYTRSPAQLMSRVNQMLIRDQVLEDTFASLLLMLWEPSKNRITYSNAGHCRPILLSPEGGAQLVEHSDLILGLDPNADYTDQSFDIPPGSALLAYTDGLIEQVGSDGRQFGEVGVAATALSALGQDRPVHGLLGALLQRSQEPLFTDDILAFWLQRR
jgi:CheY-like chemotaxis protein